MPKPLHENNRDLLERELAYCHHLVIVIAIVIADKPCLYILGLGSNDSLLDLLGLAENLSRHSPYFVSVGHRGLLEGSPCVPYRGSCG